ncbi:MAG: hypothetical protein AAFU57_08610 [Bacteroidota bacterium]
MFRKALIIFPILILCLQCRKVDISKEDWLKTKESRHYDDYARFIQKHPKSVYFESALSEYFFLHDSIADNLICCRYNASISVIDGKQLLFDEEIKMTDSLRIYSFEYLKNGKPGIPSLQRQVRIPETELNDSISKGHFDIIIYEKPLSVNVLQSMILEISNGINDYKEYLAESWYNKRYADLSVSKKKALDKLNDRRLMFFDFSGMDVKRGQPPEREEFDPLDSENN